MFSRTNLSISEILNLLADPGRGYEREVNKEKKVSTVIKEKKEVKGYERNLRNKIIGNPNRLLPEIITYSSTCCRNQTNI